MKEKTKEKTTSDINRNNQTSILDKLLRQGSPKDENTIPIIYNSENNMGFYGIEKLHHFDTKKFKGIYERLKEGGFLKNYKSVQTHPVTRSTLHHIHSEKYIKSLNTSRKVAGILEMPVFACIPNCLIQKHALKPMRYHVSGTIVAPFFAKEKGWAICLGGGMHHASATQGGGWCVYSDIPLSIHIAMKEKLIKTAMVIDLDAHQGNGIARDKLDGKISPTIDDVYIVDAYNENAYPQDIYAKKGINLSMKLNSRWSDERYLDVLRLTIQKAFAAFTPDMIYYNAGTDILEGDPLGGLHISEKACIERDRIIFEAAHQRQIPIVMTTSGGYQETNAQLIATSILQLENLLLPTSS